MTTRLIAFLLLFVSAVGGYFVSGGFLEIAIINVTVFLVLALIVATFVASKFGEKGLIYGLGVAFMISLIWPVAFLFPALLDNCEGEDCGKVTILIPPESELSK